VFSIFLLFCDGPASNSSVTLSVAEDVDGIPNIDGEVVGVDLDDDPPTALLLSTLEVVRICSKDVPGIDAPDALMLFNCESNFCSDLHHPLRVDSGTLMLRATAALDSPLRTLLTAWIFVSGDLNRRCRDLFERSNGLSCISSIF